MTAALAEPQAVRTVATVSGDPGAIRRSALAWRTQAAEWSLLADELRTAAPAEFVGDEADAYRTWLTDDWAVGLDRAAEAWGLVGRALGRYADDLDAAQQRLRALGDIAGGGDGTLGFTPTSVAAAIDPWVVFAADRALADHAEATARCRAAIDDARALCPARSGGPCSLRGSLPASAAAHLPVADWCRAAPDGSAGVLAASGPLASMAGGLRTVSGLSALAWSTIGAVPVSAPAVRPADGGCGGAPPTTDPTTPMAPSPTSSVSQWPELLGLPPDTPDLPIYDSTTTAPSVPAVAPEPTTAPAAPGTSSSAAPDVSTATGPPAPSVAPSTAVPQSPTTGQSATVDQPCSGIAGGATWDDLPRSGPFPFEPRRGQRLSDPKSISRDSKGNPIDKYGQRWRWDEAKKEWDVQNDRDDTHTNVGPNGRITHGPNNTGRNPKPDSGTANSSNWLDDLLGGVFTVRLDPDQAARVAALTALVGGAVYIFGGVLAGG